MIAMRQGDLGNRVRKGLQTIPDLGKLFFRLARDPRVPIRNKIIFGAVAAYLVIPFDVIPDWLPGIGQIDDLVLVALALDAMVNRIPKEILDEHWDGDEEALATIREILSLATMFVPKRLKDRLFSEDLSH